MRAPTLNDRCGSVGLLPTQSLLGFPPGHLSTMTGDWTVGEEYHEASLNTNLNIPVQSVGMADRIVQRATAKALRVADLDCPTFGVGTQLGELSQTTTTVGPPWLPMVIPPSELLGLDPGYKELCGGRLEQPGGVVLPHAILDPPFAHVPRGQLVPDIKDHETDPAAANSHSPSTTKALPDPQPSRVADPGRAPNDDLPPASALPIDPRPSSSSNDPRPGTGGAGQGTPPNQGGDLNPPSSVHDSTPPPMFKAPDAPPPQPAEKPGNPPVINHDTSNPPGDPRASSPAGHAVLGNDFSGFGEPPVKDPPPENHGSSPPNKGDPPDQGGEPNQPVGVVENPVPASHDQNPDLTGNDHSGNHGSSPPIGGHSPNHDDKTDHDPAPAYGQYTDTSKNDRLPNQDSTTPFFNHKFASDEVPAPQQPRKPTPDKADSPVGNTQDTVPVLNGQTINFPPNNQSPNEGSNVPFFDPNLPSHEVATPQNPSEPSLNGEPASSGDASSSSRFAQQFFGGEAGAQAHVQSTNGNAQAIAVAQAGAVYDDKIPVVAGQGPNQGGDIANQNAELPKEKSSGSSANGRFSPISQADGQAGDTGLANSNGFAALFGGNAKSQTGQAAAKGSGNVEDSTDASNMVLSEHINDGDMASNVGSTGGETGDVAAAGTGNRTAGGADIPSKDAGPERKEDTTISLDQHSILHVGTSSTTLSDSGASSTMFTLADQTFTAKPQGIMFGDSTIRPGAAAITIPASNEQHSALPQHASPAIVTVAGSAITANPTGFLIGSTSVSPGGAVVTVSGTQVSLDESGKLTVGSSTIDLVSAKSDSPITVAGQTLSPTHSGFVVAGSTVLPDGPAVTISGTPISLGEGGVLRVGSIVTTLEVPRVTTTSNSDPLTTTAPVGSTDITYGVDSAATSFKAQHRSGVLILLLVSICTFILYLLYN